MLKVGGLWVSPQEIEGTLMSHPAVLECAVVGQRDRVEMVKPKAFVCLREDYAPSDALIYDLLSHCGTFGRAQMSTLEGGGDIFATAELPASDSALP